MNFKSALSALSLGFFSLTGTQASVNFLLDAETLADANGDKISVTSAVAIVVDTAGDGFGEITLGHTASVGDFLNGVDDLIVFVDIPNNTSGEPGLVFISSSAIDTGPGLMEPTTNEQVALYWFPNVNIGEPINLGQKYGRYTDQVGIDNSNPWVVPPDPTTNYILAFGTTDSENLAGSNPPSAGFASRTVGIIPEPSTTMLFGLVALALGARRRR